MLGSIYDSELNPYSSIDDYTLDGLYTPLVNVERQDEDRKPKKVTTDINPPKRSDSRTSVDSKDMFINPADVAPTTSVSSKEASEAVKAHQKAEKEKTEEVSKEDETKSETPSEGVIEPPKRKRGRPRKIDVVSDEESKDTD